MDYTIILNNIYTLLSDIYSYIQNINFTDYLDLIIVVIIFSLIVNLNRGY